MVGRCILCDCVLLEDESWFICEDCRRIVYDAGWSPKCFSEPDWEVDYEDDI